MMKETPHVILSVSEGSPTKWHVARWRRSFASAQDDVYLQLLVKEVGFSLLEILIALSLMSGGLLLCLSEGLHAQKVMLSTHQNMQALQHLTNHQEWQYAR